MLSTVDYNQYINGIEQPIGHARIGYDSHVRDSAITASSESASFPASALGLETTYERWQAESLPATVTFDAGAAVDADYLGIAAHTLGSFGASVALYSSADNDSGFSTY